MRLLVRRSGEVWVAYLPMPTARGGQVQILNGEAVNRTIALPSREEGSIMS